MCINVLGLFSSTSMFKFMPPCSVAFPISILPVAAMSKRQNESSPHIALASASKFRLLKTGV